MKIREIINEFKEVVDNPIEYLSNIKDKEIIAYTCSYIPEEIILAFGFHPARIMGSSMSFEKAQLHFQAYACPTAKSILEDLFSPNLPANHIVIANTCDTMQRLSDIFRINAKEKNIIDFMVPTKLSSTPSKYFFYTETYNFYQKIKQLTYKKEDLKNSISMLNEIRRLIYEIQNIFLKQNLLKNKDLYYIQVAGMIMDRYLFLEKLKTIKDVLDKNIPNTQSTPKVMLTGSMCSAPFIYEVLDEFGAKVVYNDMCSGIRPYARLIEESDDPIKAIVESLISRPICAAKYIDPYSRIDHIKQTIQRTEATHIIYLVPKFCDPHCFDYPDIKNNIDLPILFLEIEQKNIELGPERTRIQAFLESI